MCLKGILNIIFINAGIKRCKPVMPETSDIKKPFGPWLYLNCKVRFSWKMGFTIDNQCPATCCRPLLKGIGAMQTKRYIPAMHFHWLTPWYDFLGEFNSSGSETQNPFAPAGAYIAW